jgi:16S rRNA (guanine966-N2)-methyltransferase
MPPRAQQLRIIGGSWRSRRIQFPDLPGLRPSPDRVRETLFNWLAPLIEGSRCLDLYAGSGALGLEALSRGAARVCFVDADRRAIDALRDNLERLGADRAQLVEADALHFLRGAPQPHDIAFLDPPFRQGLLADGLQRLAQGWLTANARVYIEMEAEAELPELPPGWEVLRSKRAGQVCYSLLTAP